MARRASTSDTEQSAPSIAAGSFFFRHNCAHVINGSYDLQWSVHLRQRARDKHAVGQLLDIGK
jgi:hypothetical protein